MQGYNDMAEANTIGVFEFSRQTLDREVIIRSCRHTPESKLRCSTNKIKELTALGQKMAGESVESVTRSVSQAFKKAS